MRNIFAAAVVVSIVAGMAIYAVSSGAEPAPVSARRSAHDFSQDELQALRRQYVAIAEKRVGWMEGPELEVEIAEMRRQNLIAELADLARQSHGFTELRASVAGAVLGAKSKEELWTLLRSMVQEFNGEKPAVP